MKDNTWVMTSQTSDYADEFTTEGFIISTETIFRQLIIYTAQKFACVARVNAEKKGDHDWESEMMEEIEIGFGTNEALSFRNFEDWLLSLRSVFISNKELEFLKDALQLELCNNYYRYGIIGICDQSIDEEDGVEIYDTHEQDEFDEFQNNVDANVFPHRLYRWIERRYIDTFNAFDEFTTSNKPIDDDEKNKLKKLYRLLDMLYYYELLDDTTLKEWFFSMDNRSKWIAGEI